MTSKNIRCGIPTLIETIIDNCYIGLTLDSRRETRGEAIPVAIRYTIHRQRWYQRLGYFYSREEFERICRASGKGRYGSNSKLLDLKKELENIFNERVSKVRTRLCSPTKNSQSGRAHSD